MDIGFRNSLVEHDRTRHRVELHRERRGALPFYTQPRHKWVGRNQQVFGMGLIRIGHRPARIPLFFQQGNTTAHIAKQENIRRSPGIRTTTPGYAARIGIVTGSQTNINVHRIGQRIAKLRVLPYPHTGRALRRYISMTAIVVQHRHVHLAISAETNTALAGAIIGDQSPELGFTAIDKKRIGIVDRKILVAQFKHGRWRGIDHHIRFRRRGPGGIER